MWEDSEEELNSEEKREVVLLEATVSSMTDDEIDNLIVLFEQSYGRTLSIVELENLIIESAMVTWIQMVESNSAWYSSLQRS